MCGIAGFNWADERLIKAMADALEHRGPDDEGILVSQDISLGHRRLSIIDLSEQGRQPMTYEHDGRRVVVTFNGEIFNYREVRQTLEDRGHRFRTATDTEIILAAYLEWGNACTSRFNGMWAFAIYDRQEYSLFCSRDRFGVKPFYYTHNGDFFAFASRHCEQSEAICS